MRCSSSRAWARTTSSTIWAAATAASWCRRRGARSIGIDIDPDRIREANANIQKSGVGARAKVVQADLFEADIGEATVVTLYLLSSLNQKLKPKLLAELKPGTRIVSHAFDMGDWTPEKTQDVGGSTVYLWRVPQKP